MNNLNKLLMLIMLTLIAITFLYNGNTMNLFDKNWKKIDVTSKKIYQELPAWPDEMRVSGDLRQWQSVAFEGEELIGVLWKSAPGVIKITNYPYDQTVYVLKGSVKLTNESGASEVFKAGSVFLLNKGFSGLWTMDDEYEELIVVEKFTFLKHEG
jgi:uncharacterized cupin superfamily protein